MKGRRLKIVMTDVALIIVLLVPMFILQGRWGVQGTTDAIAAGAPAWRLVESGTIDVTPFADQNPWFVEGRDGDYFSDRAPGLILIALPGYVIWQVEQFINGPATLMALITTLAAVLMLWWLVLPLVGRLAAFAAAVVFALGTTTWIVSAAQLWPHGPGQLAALLTVAALASERSLLAGAASAFAVALRPIAALWSAVTGLLEAWRRRDIWVAVKYGSVAASGLVLVFVYNKWLFDQVTLRGGAEGLTAGFGGYSGYGYVGNLWSMFLGWPNGVLLLSPIVLVAGIGAVRHREKVPGWAKSAAFGGLFYLVAHAALNRASGGMEIFYRYPLEPLALAAVALVIGAVALFREGEWKRFAVVAAVVVSVVLQVHQVFSLGCRAGPDILSCTLL